VLVEGVLLDLRRQGRRAVPQCWFVADFIGRHPEFHDVVA
jgi:hypothetical protein